ncbi:MAG: pyridoxal-phosphate dependent enzyme [Candidatus Aminicenantales bacterium]
MAGRRDFGEEILAACDRIESGIVHTPVEFSRPLSEMTGARVFIKWECEQFTGSFKLRGALNKLRSLTPAEKAAGVVSASTGNHGLAMSRASNLEKVALKLFLPVTASEVKRRKIEELGVAVESYGTDCGKTEVHAREEAARTGRGFVSPYNDWDIVFGAGTVGLEIARDVPDVDDVIVPVGGGGLIAGIAAALRAFRPAARTVGVEPEASAFMAASVASGRLVDIAERETIADAVAGGIEPGSITFPLYRELVDRTLMVAEAEIANAMALVFRAHGKIIEGAGALPLAGLLGSAGAFQGRRVVLVVSGKNISPDRFREVSGLG